MVFEQNSVGLEAYVVVRGQVDMRFSHGAPIVHSAGIGQIFGEVTFLDAGRRALMAVSARPSILLILDRGQFLHLAEKEPHLGMKVMHNLATGMSPAWCPANDINARDAGIDLPDVQGT